MWEKALALATALGFIAVWSVGYVMPKDKVLAAADQCMMDAGVPLNTSPRAQVQWSVCFTQAHEQYSTILLTIVGY